MKVTIYFAGNTISLNFDNDREAEGFLTVLSGQKGLYIMPVKDDKGGRIAINVDQIQYIQTARKG